MADRTVSIRLLLNTAGFLAGAKVADAQARKLATSIERSAAKRQAINEVGNAFGVMGAAAGVASFAVVKSAADFDQAMSNVQAATHASAVEQQRLRDAAVEAGQRTQYSATEAAGAIENLAKAGVSSTDIIGGGLNGALNLAAAGGMDVADAAEVAATAMTQFKLSGQDVPHVADLLAAAAGKAQGDVTDMSYALRQSGLVASQMGLSIEETTGTLAAFASSGLLGSDAGTSFRTMLLRLANPSEQAAERMKDLGIEAYDAQGNFIGMDALAGQLQDGLSGLTQKQRDAALAMIFGQDAIRGANVLYQQGARGIADWTNKVDDAGYAQETASIKMDNLRGDLERLKGALETAFIGTGSGAQGPLRDLLQLVTKLVDGYNALPDPIKSMTGATLLAVTAVGGLGFAASRTITGLANMRSNLSTVKSTVTEAGVSFGDMNKKMLIARGGAAALAAGLPLLLQATGNTSDTMNDLSSVLSGVAGGFAVGGPWGAAIGGGIGLLSALTSGSDDAAQAQAELDATIAEVAQTLNQQTGAITENTTAWLRKKLADDGVYDAAERLGLNLGLVTRAAMGNADAAERLRHAYAGLGDKTSMSNGDFLQLVIGVDKYSKSIAGAQDKTRQQITAQRQMAQSTESTTGEVQDQTQALAKNIKQLEQRTIKLLENTDKTVAFQEALDASTKALRGNNDSLDLSTKKGRENYQVIRDQIAAALDFRDGTNKQKAAIRDTIDTLLDFRNEARQNGEKVPAWIDQQIRKFRELQRQANMSLTGIKDEDVDVNLTASAARIAKVEWQLNRASGGAVYGPGTATSDSIPARLSNGERVTATRVVNAAGRGDNRRGQQVMAAIERMILRGELGKYGDVPAFAGGGAVHPYLHTRGMDSAINTIQRWVDASGADLSDLLSAAISKAISFLPTAGQLGPDGRLTPAQIVRGQDFAKSQQGKPYGWTGVGPSYYDCSGFQSAVVNSALGNYPYSRLGSTGTMPWAGSAPGVGRYTIGWSTNVGGSGIGHTSGNIGGLGVESRGGDGVVVGTSARSPLDSMFYGLMHYDSGSGILRSGGYTLAGNFTGRDEVVRFADGGAVEAHSGKPKLPVSERPLTNQMVHDVLERIRDHFGDHSPLVDIIRQWLDGMKRGELTDRALAQRIDKALRHQIEPAIRQFQVGPRQTVGETRSEVRDLVRTMAQTFGRDAPIVGRIDRLGDRLLDVQARQDKVANQYARANDKLDAIVDKQRQFASEVRAAFSHDAFGSDVESVRESLIQMRADANDATRATRQFRRLGRKGLDDSIIRHLAASGNTSLLRQLSGMSPKEIAAYERAFKRRQHALGELGQLAGRQVFGDERREQIQVTRKLDHRLNKLDHTLNRLERRVEHGAEKGVRRGMGDHEHHQRRRRRAKAVR